MRTVKNSTRVALVFTTSAVMCLTACGGSKSSGASSSSAASGKSSAASSKSPASSASAGSGALVDDAGLKSMSAKLGCPSPEVGKLTSKAKSAGAASAMKCTPGSMLYMLVRTKSSGQVDNFMKVFVSEGDFHHNLPYVKGANWLVVSSGTGEKDLPTIAEAQDVQKKLGGTVATTH